MIERIKALMLGGGPDAGGDGGNGVNSDDADGVRVAAVALLVEAAVMDGDFDADERAVIAGLVAERFGLEGAEVEALIADAEDAVERSHQLFAFTRVVKQGFDAEARVEMIEMLWEVAYADGRLHDYEASLIRRVAGLIHVSDRDSGLARKRALARLGLEPPP